MAIDTPRISHWEIGPLTLTQTCRDRIRKIALLGGPFTPTDLWRPHLTARDNHGYGPACLACLNPCFPRLDT